MRPRKRDNRNLPPNLYLSKKGKKYYYRYRNPRTGKETGMGINRIAAIKAANHLNGMFEPPPDLVYRVTTGQKNLATWIDDYKTILSERDLSPVTMSHREWQLRTIKAEIGVLLLTDVTTRNIAEFLDERPPRMSNMFRSTLLDMFREAIAKGYLETNPVEPTKNKKYVVARTRLSLEQYRDIFKASVNRPWLQRAMELSLVTLQRREDIAAMQFTDIKDGHLHVIQKKSGAPLRISVTGELEAIIRRCRDRVLSRYLVHHGKARTSRKPGDSVSLNTISYSFATTRDETGLFDKMPKEQRPSFHEIRSLGARLYEKQGIDSQTMLGHKKRRMTEEYLDEREVKWQDVTPNLKL